jgi:hypothetical protein
MLQSCYHRNVPAAFRRTAKVESRSLSSGYVGTGISHHRCSGSSSLAKYERLCTSSRIVTTASSNLFAFFASVGLWVLLFILNKLLHAPQPLEVLLLLLDIDVIRNEHRETGIHASLLQIRLHQRLQLLVQLLERWTGVEVLVCAAKQLFRVCYVVREVGHAVDGEGGAVGYEVDAEGAGFALALDEDVNVGWEGLLVFVVVLDGVSKNDRRLYTPNC